MVDTNNILEEINNMIRKHLNYDISITKDMYLEDGQNGVAGLGLDSLEIVKLIVMIEDKYNIIVDFNVRFWTIGDMVEYVLSNI